MSETHTWHKLTDDEDIQLTAHCTQDKQRDVVNHLHTLKENKTERL